MEQVKLIAGIVIVVFIALVTIGLILSKLFRRASKEISFVRTGFGGQKIIMNGGALVLPVLHETIPVNMNTLRLEVKRSKQQALITKDRMRVDVDAEFYVRVKPTVEAIADAAQTLGMRTMKPESLKELVEGKFVDALRSVAAEMEMEQLHEKRVDFVQKVQMAVSEDLLKNGLELESVSPTGLDQTSREFFNPQNAFDAQGLTKLTEQVEARNKQRNDIEQDTKIEIQMKNLEAERKNLELKKEEEYARLEQDREISIRKAAQTTEVRTIEAGKNREAKEAEIVAKQKVEHAEINSNKAIEEEKIDRDRLLKEKEIQKTKTIETATIEKEMAIKISEQEQSIAIAEKSKEQSIAQGEADRAKAQAVKILAEAEADRLTIATRAEAESEKLKAEAAATKYEVDAKGKKAINEADNVLSDEQVGLRLKTAVLASLPKIIGESVKPIEKIDGIKIVHVDGLHGGNGSNGSHGSSNSNNLADELVNSALRYRGQAPLLDSILKEVGITGGDINSFTAPIMEEESLTNGEKALGEEKKIAPKEIQEGKEVYKSND
ncbi:MAG: flotillin family protein [Nitrospinota bacterium]